MILAIIAIILFLILFFNRRRNRRRKFEVLDFKNFQSLPPFLDNEDLYDLFNWENLDEVYSHWLNDIQCIRHIYFDTAYVAKELKPLVLFFNNGIGKLKNSPLCMPVIFRVSLFYDDFLNQDIYNYYIKQNLDQVEPYDFHYIQQFFSNEELIDYAYQGYTIETSKITDEKFRKQMEFLQALYKKDREVGYIS